MRTLYYWPLDPASRQARIALGEKKLKFKLEKVDPWVADGMLQELSPEAIPPILEVSTPEGSRTLAGARSICEYAHDIGGKHALLSSDVFERAEARRLCDWFCERFHNEVNAYILHERIEKPLHLREAADPATLRIGRDHLAFHLDYVAWLLSKRSWLAGKSMSLADIAAGAHLSCLDYLGEIRWKTRPTVKEWYQKLKCRPGFRPLLGDRIPGLTPPYYYADLDF